MSNLKFFLKTMTVVALLCISGTGSADVSGMLKMCVTCHGEDGRGTEASTPIIAGIPAVNQEDAIYAYVDGGRNCGTQPMMCKLASRLTDDQIVELAAHYSAMPFGAADEEFDAALAETGKTIHKENCAICHGLDDPGDSEASILHGQRKGYLRNVMQQYAAGERDQLPAMEKKISSLSSDDVEALLNYYASYRNP